jgi:hypothetical protein
MRKSIWAAFGFIVALLTLTLARPAMANETPAFLKQAAAPSFKTCPNLQGWYGNPDEQDDLPDPTEAGLKFEGKDLIHHKTSLALTDVKAGSFVAEGDALKVVLKYETDSPYTTIVQTPEGKFWSSHISSGKGSQDQPVDMPHDLVGIPQRGASGGLTEDTRVVSFGPGYWTETGSTVVSSVKFHGETFDLTCKPAATTPPTSKPPTKKPSPSHSTSTGAGGLPGGGNNTSSGALAITGPSTPAIVGLGAAILAVGGGLFWMTRRRRARFIP